MRIFAMCTSAVVLFSAVAFAGMQQSGQAAQRPSPASSPSSSNPASASSNQALRMAPGTVIPVELTKGIDAKKAKTGDGIEAKVTQDLKAANGEVVLPKDTKVIGHVTEAQARNKEQKESQVGIAFDRAVMKNGGDVPLPMSIQAIIGPSALGSAASNNPAPGGGLNQPTQTRTPGAMPSSGGRMGGENPSAATSPGPAEVPSAGKAGNPHPPITPQTQGVVGISNLELSTTNAALGSVVSSEKSNVKLDSGTLMLLRVSQ